MRMKSQEEIQFELDIVKAMSLSLNQNNGTTQIVIDKNSPERSSMRTTEQSTPSSSGNNSSQDGGHSRFSGFWRAISPRSSQAQTQNQPQPQAQLQQFPQAQANNLRPFSQNQSKFSVCPMCKLEVNKGRYIRIHGITYHADCFQCQLCKDHIEDPASVVLDQQNRRPYHPDCHRIHLEAAPVALPVIEVAGTAPAEIDLNGKRAKNPDIPQDHIITAIKVDNTVPMKGGLFLSNGVSSNTSNSYSSKRSKPNDFISNDELSNLINNIMLPSSNAPQSGVSAFPSSNNPLNSNNTFRQPQNSAVGTIAIPPANSKPSTTNKNSNIANSNRMTTASVGSVTSNKSSGLFSSFNSTLESLGSPTCAYCQQNILFGSYLETKQNGKCYHRECFICTGCSQIINQKEYVLRDDLPFHPNCAAELFHPRCCLCSSVISGRYYRHPFFEEEIYCIESDHTNRARQCYACGRYEPTAASGKPGHIALAGDPSGRVLCRICANTVVMTSEEAQIIYREIIGFMERDLNFAIPKEMYKVPILAVDHSAMNENYSRSLNGATHGVSGMAGDGGTAPSVTTRGLTLSTIGNIKHFNRHLFDSTTSWMNNALPLGNAPIENLTSAFYQIEEVRDVTAVLILYGLPYDLAASVIAHEAMHVWIKLTKTMPFSLPSKVEEGICQLVAYRFLEKLYHEKYSEIDRVQSSSVKSKGVGAGLYSEVDRERVLEAKLCQYFKHSIESDPSTVYGDGFREAAQIEASLGLDILLEYVAHQKDFPTV